MHRLHNTILSLQKFTPELNSALNQPYDFKQLENPNPLISIIEAARIANQLVEHILAFDQDGTRARSGISRLTLLRAGVDSRAFVELYEAFLRDLLDGGECGKEVRIHEARFWDFWRAMEWSVGRLMDDLRVVMMSSYFCGAARGGA